MWSILSSYANLYLFRLSTMSGDGSVAEKGSCRGASLWLVPVRYDGIAKAREGNNPPNPVPHDNCCHSDKVGILCSGTNSTIQNLKF